jgi:hypothetical protein
VREDRGNRWFIVAFTLIGLSDAYLPAYADRKDFWTIQSLCSAVGSAGLSRSRLGTRWSPAVFTPRLNVLQRGLIWSSQCSRPDAVTCLTRSRVAYPGGEE